MHYQLNGLLRKAADKRPHLSWRTECVYTDGEGRHLHRLTATKRDGRKAIDAVYCAQTGSISRLRWRGYEGRRADNVVDLLLDAMTVEV